MTTKAHSSKTFKLQRGDDAGSVFTNIAEVTSMNGPDEKASQIDVTSFDSTAMEYIAGLTDGGEVSFDFNFVGSDAQQAGLRTDLRAGTVRSFKAIANDHASDPSNVTFTAIVTALSGFKAGVNQALKGSCSLKISGLPTWDLTTGV